MAPPAAVIVASVLAIVADVGARLSAVVANFGSYWLPMSASITDVSCCRRCRLLLPLPMSAIIADVSYLLVLSLLSLVPMLLVRCFYIARLMPLATQMRWKPPFCSAPM
jgi:hypothetical protein